jgi:hypothetical protein
MLLLRRASDWQDPVGMFTEKVGFHAALEVPLAGTRVGKVNRGGVASGQVKMRSVKVHQRPVWYKAF